MMHQGFFYGKNKLILREKYFLAYLNGLFLFFLSFVAYTEPELTELLTTDILQSTSIVSFLPTVGMAHPISGIHLHYLQSSDCYSGYAGGFYSKREKDEYVILENKPFMLNGKAAYSVGAFVVRGVQMNDIHSILIRLVREERGNVRPSFAFFIGDCEDQDINCCIPVNCSNETEICLPQHQFPIQYIFWR